MSAANDIQKLFDLLYTNKNIWKINSYFNKLDYINDNSPVSPLTVGNLLYIFAIYFSILITILAIYLAYNIFLMAKNLFDFFSRFI